MVGKVSGAMTEARSFQQGVEKQQQAEKMQL